MSEVTGIHGWHWWDFCKNKRLLPKQLQGLPFQGSSQVSQPKKKHTLVYPKPLALAEPYMGFYVLSGPKKPRQGVTIMQTAWVYHIGVNQTQRVSMVLQFMGFSQKRVKRKRLSYFLPSAVSEGGNKENI